MFICQNSEGVHPYLLKCCRGTCSFVGMLKGYMVRKRLGTPVLNRVHSENFPKKCFRTTVGMSMDMKYECEARYI